MSNIQSTGGESIEDVTVNQGTTPWITKDAGLPTSVGQKIMAESTSVTIASDQTPISVTDTSSSEIIGILSEKDNQILLQNIIEELRKTNKLLTLILT